MVYFDDIDLCPRHTYVEMPASWSAWIVRPHISEMAFDSNDTTSWRRDWETSKGTIYSHVRNKRPGSLIDFLENCHGGLALLTPGR